MIVTYMCEDRLYDAFLPEKIRGQYWMEDLEQSITSESRRLFNIEAIDGKWRIWANKALKLYTEEGNAEEKYIDLEEGRLYIALLGKEQKKGYIFAETYKTDRCTYTKYCVNRDITLTIGKSDTNSIQVQNPYISSKHAQLTLQNGSWTILDNNSANGVYVNNIRMHGNCSLNPGDVVYILGFKMVVGHCFVAMNNPENTVTIHTEILKPYKARLAGEYEIPEEEKEKIYYRSPRFKRDMTKFRLTIDGPTAPESRDSTPLALSLAPSLVMGCASFASGIVTTATTIRNGGDFTSSIPTMVMCISMLCGMIVFPFIMKVRDKKMAKGNEILRRNKYLKYLSNIRSEINRESNRQKEIMNENYPHIMQLLADSQFYENILWSRVIGQEDFLTLRIGVGNVPFWAELKFPEQRFSIDDDVMREEVNKFSEEKKMLESVPATFSLLENRVSGIIGDGLAVEGMMHNILLQIAAFHSYDEVKVVFICEEKDLRKYEYVRWMQHCWNNEGDFRYLATSPEEVRELSAYFSRVFNKRREDPSEKCPHYVVISASKALSDICAFVAELLKDTDIPGFSYLAVYDEMKNLPKECSVVIQMNRSQGMMYNRLSQTQEKVVFVQDQVIGRDAAKNVMNIAEYTLDLQQGKYALPSMLTFLDMFGAGKIEHLNIATRWKENNPVITLQTPVGVDSNGSSFYLDLHEKAHGPHGLVAGMTGSGKSEFIITFILSLAVNYHPDEVAFILIDYKGGGLTGAFENDNYRLPHLAGTITNLDGASITRSLLSIQSELRKRQAKFNEARRVSNEGTMDIYKYQKLYRNGVVKDPVPHLFIISDEFAELKTQQPEFMEQLISTARIGRSLGVHLILATQKPNGVVNDQIWANSKFKVCLKVQDRADSMDMLKRPDAAELVETGRFYLQVGYNELYELGQSAWCGAPYIPADRVEKSIDDKVQLIDHLGNVIEEAKPWREVKEKADTKRQIVEIMQYISQIAKEEHASAKALWLPEIPDIITVDDTKKKYHYHREAEYLLNPVIGEYDDPFNQRQDILTLPLSQLGNAIVYGAVGSGKTTFLTALLYSLYEDHSSAVLNTYILDFGAETLGMFAHAPQTADFVIAGEDEKLNNLFAYLKRETERRKKLFTEYGGDYLSYVKTGKEILPNIVVVINNYPNLAEQYEQLDEKITIMTRECSKYGVYFIVTSPSVMGIRYRLQQNFTQSFVLQLNDESDYASVLGRTGGVYPSRKLGRGIFKKQDVYVYQTAHVTEDTEHTGEFVRTFCSRLEQESGQEKARPIPVMPRLLYQKTFEDMEIEYQSIPVGIAAGTLERYIVDMRKYGVLPIFAMEQSDITYFLEGLANLLLMSRAIDTYVLDPRRLLSLERQDQGHYILDNAEETIVSFFKKTVDRHNTYKSTNGNVPEGFDMHPIVVIINGLGALKEQLSDDGRSKLKNMMEKTHGKLNLSFIVADDHMSSNRYSAEGWCAGSGIWVGSGIEEQQRFVFNKKMTTDTDLDFTTGYVVEKNKATLVKLLVSDNARLEDEDE